MNKFLIIYGLMLITLISRSQFQQRIYFNNLFSENLASGCKSILEIDSSYYGCGLCLDSISGLKNIVVLKLNLNGDSIFSNEFNVNNSFNYPGQGSSFHQISDSTFANAGSASLKGSLRIIDLSGDTVWTRLYTSQLGDQLIIDHCKQLTDRGFVMTGQDCYIDAYADVVLIKVDSSGNELWRNFYGWQNSEDRGYKVLPTGDHGFLISGYTSIPNDPYSGEALLIKTDSIGTMEWCRTPGNPDYRDGYGSVTIAQDGNYVFGYTYAVYQAPPYPVPDSFRKIRFMKFNQNGDTLWDRMYGNAWQINMLRNIITLEDGGLLAVGYANSDTVDLGPMRGWLFKINQYGDSIWYREYSHYTQGPVLNYLYDVFETSDGGIIACGESFRAVPGPEGIQRMWVLKLDSAGCEYPGCDPTVGIAEMEPGRRGEWEKGSVELWPNPASTQISISLSNRQSSVVSLQSFERFSMEVYDIFGRKAPIPAPIHSTPSPALPLKGKGEVVLDISSLPPGLYLLVVKDGQTVKASAKFVVAW